jgi:hypothetical protein
MATHTVSTKLNFEFKGMSVCKSMNNEYQHVVQQDKTAFLSRTMMQIFKMQERD